MSYGIVSKMNIVIMVNFNYVFWWFLGFVGVFYYLLVFFGYVNLFLFLFISNVEFGKEIIGVFEDVYMGCFFVVSGVDDEIYI